MKVIRAFFMCLGMFSALPCPWRPWDEDARGLMTACLPLVGAMIGGLWYALSLLGRALLPDALTAALMQYLSNLGAAYATLEVRKSNVTAQNLYKSLGYVSVGVRKRYYEDNGEDALLMVCEHMPEADPDFTEPETLRE